MGVNKTKTKSLWKLNVLYYEESDDHDKKAWRKWIWWVKIGEAGVKEWVVLTELDWMGF